MAIGHIAIRTHSRRAGHSAAAALAYRWGIALTDCRTGERHDFTARGRSGDVLATGTASCREQPLFADCQAFADAVETAERRCDSRILRDVQPAIPAELGEAERVDLVREFSAALARDWQTEVRWAIHAPDQAADERNVHAHIVMPTRAIEGDALGAKLRELDNPRTSGDAIARIRNLWASHADAALERAGSRARVHVGQRLDDEPAITLGAAVTGMERRAAASRRGGHAVRSTTAAALVAGSDCVTDVGQRAGTQARARQPRTSGDQATHERRARSRRQRWHDAQRATAEPEPGDPDAPSARTRRTRSRQEPTGGDERTTPTRAPRKRRRRVRRDREELVAIETELGELEDAKRRAGLQWAVAELDRLEEENRPQSPQEPREEPQRTPPPTARAKPASPPPQAQETHPVRSTPPRTPAHADTNGIPPARPHLLRDAAEAVAEREAARERALRERLAHTLQACTEAAGEALIQKHAGHASAYPTLPGAGPATRRAALAALEPHVEPYQVAERHRRRGYDPARVQTCIARWRRYFQRHAQRIVEDLTAAAWPAAKREETEQLDQARAAVHQSDQLAEARRQWRRRQEDAARARGRRAVPGAGPHRRGPGRD